MEKEKKSSFLGLGRFFPKNERGGSGSTKNLSTNRTHDEAGERSPSMELSTSGDVPSPGEQTPSEIKKRSFGSWRSKKRRSKDSGSASPTSSPGPSESSDRSFEIPDGDNELKPYSITVISKVESQEISIKQKEPQNILQESMDKSKAQAAESLKRDTTRKPVLSKFGSLFNSSKKRQIKGQPESPTSPTNERTVLPSRASEKEPVREKKKHFQVSGSSDSKEQKQPSVAANLNNSSDETSKESALLTIEGKTESTNGKSDNGVHESGPFLTEVPSSPDSPAGIPDLGSNVNLKPIRSPTSKTAEKHGSADRNVRPLVPSPGRKHSEGEATRASCRRLQVFSPEITLNKEESPKTLSKRTTKFSSKLTDSKQRIPDKPVQPLDNTETSNTTKLASQAASDSKTKRLELSPDLSNNLDKVHATDNNSPDEISSVKNISRGAQQEKQKPNGSHESTDNAKVITFDIYLSKTSETSSTTSQEGYSINGGPMEKSPGNRRNSKKRRSLKSQSSQNEDKKTECVSPQDQVSDNDFTFEGVTENSTTPEPTTYAVPLSPEANGNSPANQDSKAGANHKLSPKGESDKDKQQHPVSNPLRRKRENQSATVPVSPTARKAQTRDSLFRNQPAAAAKAAEGNQPVLVSTTKDSDVEKVCAPGSLDGKGGEGCVASSCEISEECTSLAAGALPEDRSTHSKTQVDIPIQSSPDLDVPKLKTFVKESSRSTVTSKLNIPLKLKNVELPLKPKVADSTESIPAPEPHTQKGNIANKISLFESKKTSRQIDFYATKNISQPKKFVERAKLNIGKQSRGPVQRFYSSPNKPSSDLKLSENIKSENAPSEVKAEKDTSQTEFTKNKVEHTENDITGSLMDDLKQDLNTVVVPNAEKSESGVPPIKTESCIQINNESFAAKSFEGTKSNVQLSENNTENCDTLSTVNTTDGLLKNPTVNFVEDPASFSNSDTSEISKSHPVMGNVNPKQGRSSEPQSKADSKNLSKDYQVVSPDHVDSPLPATSTSATEQAQGRDDNESQIAQSTHGKDKSWTHETKSQKKKYLAKEATNSVTKKGKHTNNTKSDLGQNKVEKQSSLNSEESTDHLKDTKQLPETETTQYGEEDTQGKQFLQTLPTHEGPLLNNQESINISLDGPSKSTGELNLPGKNSGTEEALLTEGICALSIIEDSGSAKQEDTLFKANSKESIQDPERTAESEERSSVVMARINGSGSVSDRTNSLSPEKNKAGDLNANDTASCTDHTVLSGGKSLDAEEALLTEGAHASSTIENSGGMKEEGTLFMTNGKESVQEPEGKTESKESSPVISASINESGSVSDRTNSLSPEKNKAGDINANETTCCADHTVLSDGVDTLQNTIEENGFNKASSSDDTEKPAGHIVNSDVNECEVEHGFEINAKQDGYSQNSHELPSRVEGPGFKESDPCISIENSNTASAMEPQVLKVLQDAAVKQHSEENCPINISSNGSNGEAVQNTRKALSEGDQGDVTTRALLFQTVNHNTDNSTHYNDSPENLGQHFTDQEGTLETSLNTSVASDDSILDSSSDMEKFAETIRKLDSPITLPQKRKKPRAPKSPGPFYGLPPIREDYLEKILDTESFSFGLGKKDRAKDLAPMSLFKLQSRETAEKKMPKRASAEQSLLLKSLKLPREPFSIPQETCDNETTDVSDLEVKRSRIDSIYSSLKSPLAGNSEEKVFSPSVTTVSTINTSFTTPQKECAPPGKNVEPTMTDSAKTARLAVNEHTKDLTDSNGPVEPGNSNSLHTDTTKLPLNTHGDNMENQVETKNVLQASLQLSEIRLSDQEDFPDANLSTLNGNGMALPPFESTPNFDHLVGNGIPEDLPEIFYFGGQNTSNVLPVLGTTGIPGQGVQKINPRPGKVVILTEAEYGGTVLEVYTDVADCTAWELSPTILVKTIRGCWILYEYPNFQGRSIALEEGDLEISNPWGEDSQTENNAPSPTVIGSLRHVVKDYRVCQIDLFTEPGGLGVMTSYFDDTEELQVYGRLQRTCSLKVHWGVWLIYEEPGFQGIPYILEPGEYPDLSFWNTHEAFIGSMRPLKMGSRKVEIPYEPKIAIYEKPMFEGRCVEFDKEILKLEELGNQEDSGEEGALPFTTVGSMRVFSGLWVGYEKPGFEGHQYLLEEGDYEEWTQWGGFDGLLQSLRPILSDFSAPHMTMYSEKDLDEKGPNINVLGIISNMEETGYGVRTQSINVLSGVWVAYETPDFTGEQYILEKGVFRNSSDWGAKNCKISSVQPIVLDTIENPRGAFKVELFSEPDFKGQSLVFDEDTKNIDDSFTSKSCKVVSGRWAVYDKEEFSGNLWVLEEGSFPNLCSMGCKHDTTIRSVKIINYEFSDPSIVLYGKENFKGRKVKLTTDTINIQAMGYSPDLVSLEVLGGIWVLYEYSNYRGRQAYVLPGKVAQWNQFNDWDRVGSLRPLRQKRLYFKLRNKASGMLMSTNGTLDDIKLLRIQVMEDTGAEDQIWVYQDGTLRCRIAEDCSLATSGSLVTAGSKLGLALEQTGASMLWSISPDSRIYCCSKPNLVLDIKGGNQYDQQHVVLNPVTEGKLSQLWEICVL
ncbi:beta/gamma crystallin domain-containing protein 1 [Spea bombifrons]|uniref:beta/gamma crystallin domain-containing protein 1 n=1 Tax=Spea bombifrons TaxID=233779 RepID=UPI00234B0E41|nr:beta/gamma crystallin domain-containing protein 1 [Spea bombifrons]